MKRSLYLLPSLAAAAVLAACSPGDERTVGQQVDEAVSGARSSANDAGTVVAAAATDAMITTKINAALAADDQLKATKIDVDTSNGRVVLNGSAPDLSSRERATSLARAVEGVVDVDNRLTVSGS